MTVYTLVNEFKEIIKDEGSSQWRSLFFLPHEPWYITFGIKYNLMNQGLHDTEIRES